MNDARGRRSCERCAIAVAVVISAAILASAPGLMTSYYLGLLTKALIFSLFAMSLDLLVGYTGLASLGHAAYFGLAAYVTGLTAIKLGWGVGLALPAGMMASALAAVLFGLLALRTRGSYFLMITLALSQLVWGIAVGWRSMTGGDDGLPNIPRPRLGALSLSDESTFYYFVLAFTVAGTFLLVRIVRSPFGRALQGIRESETRMLALGYDVWRYKFVAFAIAAVGAGTAGSLYVYFNQFVSPDYLHVARSAEALLMVILGGAGTLLGPACGAALLVVLENAASAHTERWVTLLGLLYALGALGAPHGIGGALRSLRRWHLERSHVADGDIPERPDGSVQTRQEVT